MGAPAVSFSQSQSPVLLNYRIREQLATGGMSTVYRAKHLVRPDFVAIKIVPLKLTNPSPADTVKAKTVLREMRIHETLKCDQVLQLMGGECRGSQGMYAEGLWMLLELADSGDLFDKITPDVGLPEDIAHMFFTQLIRGLKYLGHQGICHRDIKPENCLLDASGNLKISDFGLASVFKYKGQSRLLRERCGSPPYAAPELARTDPYAGEPLDIWSAGIVLFTLLAGNTPWDQPTSASPEFAAYLAGLPTAVQFSEEWRRIARGATTEEKLQDIGALQLLLKLLQVDPGRRATIKQIENDSWFMQPNPLIGPDGLCADGPALCRRMTRSMHQHGYLGAPSQAFEQVTQNPTPMNFSQRGLDPDASFRSSLQLYSKLSMAPTQRLNPNLTRFFTTLPVDTFITHLTSALTSLGITHQVLSAPAGGGGNAEMVFLTRVKITGRDKRGERLDGSIAVTESTLPDLEEVSEMDVDMDDDDEGSARQKGTKGHDVVMWKKQADPLELKRLWARIMDKLPREAVFAT